ncbi:MAG: hypothetical protein PHS80_00880 [Methanothrix sp.]|nr:hypothetical protein [Methanothrix sp.]MDD4446130.1 hypothetical protein [Methanothrix sp.]
MFSLTYDLWKEIIEDIAQAHDSLFAAMHQAAEELQLSAALIDDLKKKRELTIANDPWELQLAIEFIDDKINGFTIFLVAKEPLEVLEEIKANIASDQGFSLEDIEGFELEHGLDMQEEIFVEIEESYGVTAEIRENVIIYELVVFDSQDIDNSLSGNLAQDEDLVN